MLLTGIIVGIIAYCVYLSTRCLFRVEQGHTAVLTSFGAAVKDAVLVAEAKCQYPAAVGRAYAELRRRAKVFEAYRELYELSQLRPGQTVAFKDFTDGDMRPIEAAMLPSPTSPAGRAG